MKKCTWCGKEYPDSATTCTVDAQPLETVGSSATSSEKAGQQATSDSTANDFTDAAAKKNMLVGGLWCIGGVIVTAVTYLAASSNPSGGSYLIAWGAILFGGLQFIRGFIAVSSTSNVVDPPKDAQINQSQVTKPVTNPKTWTCAKCGETSESQFTSCWKCRTPRSDSVI